MNLAAIILQLVSLCDAMGGNTIASCKSHMITCANKNYSNQSLDTTSDYCFKKYMKDMNK